MKLIKKILDFIYPPAIRCCYCGRELKSLYLEIGLCQDCLKKLHFIDYKRDQKGRRFINGKQYFDFSFSVLLYEGLIKELIYRLKYQGDRDIVFPMVEIMYRHLPPEIFKLKWDGLIPVPMHINRLKERSYNQAALLAEGLAFYLNLPYYEGVFRIKETLPQNKLKLKERILNLQDGFDVRDIGKIEKGRWLVIDDILTTGTTVNEVAKVLKRGGSTTVGVYTLASGNRDVYL